MEPVQMVLYSPAARPWYRKRSGAFFVLLAGMGLFIIAGLVYFFFPSEEGPIHTKLITPVGEDFFSAEFAQGYEAIGAYVIPVTVGTNISTSLFTLLDTGSAQTWIKASTSVSSRSRSFKAYPRSSYSAAYMGGVVSGFQAEDTLGINGYTWTQRMGVVNSGSMLDSLGRINALMGLSRGGCDFIEGQGQLCSHANWPLKESVFSFYYDTASWRGVFTAGFVDEAMYCEDSMHWMRQRGSYFWSAEISGFYVNNKKVASKVQGIFDTGTTYMFMNAEYYGKVFGDVLAKTGCGNPEFKLEMNGRNFTIPVEVLKKNGDVDCGLRVDAYQGATSLSEDLLIGAVFLVNYYTVFDLGNDRIGFCTPKQGLSVGRRLEDAEERAKRISELLDHPGRNVLPNLSHVKP